MNWQTGKQILRSSQIRSLTMDECSGTKSVVILGAKLTREESELGSGIS